MRRSLLALAAVVLLAGASAASAQTVINSVPFTISASGKYVLGGNLATTSANQTAITISAPNVILDLNQFFVSGPGNTPASATPVISVANVSNVTIRNGTVANNAYGIYFAGGANSINHLVEKVNVTRCYLAGIYFLAIGASSGSIVRENTVSQTGNSTLNGSPQSAFGIYTGGGVRIEDNTITDVSSTGTSGVTISGIDATSTDVVIGNTISNSTGNGVHLGKCQNNLTNNCGMPFLGTTDAGGNF